MPETIDEALVRRLVAAQFPQWARLPVRPVPAGGWDNRTFRLGDDLSVRLPSADGYVAQVAKEQRWLPYLAARLPLPVPVPVAAGRPGPGFTRPWSVNRWIHGETARPELIDDLGAFAVDLAGFLTALRAVEPGGGPAPGAHSAWRGGPLTTYDGATRRAIRELDLPAPVTAIWADALAAEWTGPPVWFHGDVAVGNLLLRDHRLAAVIDFGCCGVGDPACDLVIAWTLFTGASREAFREAVGADAAQWARGRGWALWKALIQVAGHHRDDPAARAAVAVLDGIRADAPRSDG